MKLSHFAVVRACALLASMIASSAAAPAATPWIASHGPVQGADVPPLSPAFNARFPAARFEVFVYSDAFIVGDQQACHAIVGVSPRDSFQFPIHHYSATQTRPGRSMTAGEERSFALDCVTEAVRNMLSDDLDRVYQPYPSKTSKK